MWDLGLPRQGTREKVGTPDLLPHQGLAKKEIHHNTSKLQFEDGWGRQVEERLPVVN